jgi:hypothetical protein
MWKSTLPNLPTISKSSLIFALLEKRKGAQMIVPEHISVELRLAKPNEKVKAFADVTIRLGDSGEIMILGFSVIGTPPLIVPPARPGKQRYFDVVRLEGKLKALIYTTVGNAYKKALADTTREVA